VEPWQNVIPQVQLYITALAFAIIRPIAIFAIFPVIARLGLPRLLQIPIVIALSVPILIQVHSQLRGMDSVTPLFIAAVCVKEVLIGLLLGIIAGVPFWIMEMAGNIVDFVRQAPDAEVQDPQGTTQASISGNLFAIVVTLYFISAGGLSIFAKTIYQSYEIWPALSNFPFPDSSGAAKVIGLVDFLVRSALLIAAPLVTFIMVGFLIVIIIAKILPQMNVFTLSMAFRNFAFFVAVQIFGIYLISSYTSNLTYIKDTLQIAKAFINGE
jgi:type III secretion protein T